MKKLRLILISVCLVVFMNSCKTENKALTDRDMDQYIDELVSKMSLDEKIGQLSLFTTDWSPTGPSIRKDYADLIREGKAGAIFNAYTIDFVRDLQKTAVEETRLHIPLIFGFDVIHGHRTVFPIPLAQAATWDTALISSVERIAATEASAEGLNWTFAPMVDLSRDPRWGRVMEGSGEDTWLGSLIAAARVKGFQGNSLADSNTVMACVKHFAAYGAPQGGRDYNTVDISARSLYEWYLPVYKAAVDADVGSVMTSFNEIAGVPSTSNKWLLTTLLRDQWKFTGFVVTDYGSINELIPHGVAANQEDATELSINAGVDMDMQGSAFLNCLSGLVKSGRVSEGTINNAVRRVLEAKYKLGLFDDPYRYCSKTREQKELMKPEFLEFARKTVASSCVLLKNDRNTLPVSKSVGTIAVIGPLADSRADMLGSWSAAGEADKCVTLLQGIKNKIGGSASILTEKGCNINDKDRSGFERAVSIARRADFIILALGESSSMSGESASRTDISLPGVQMDLAEAIIKTGKPVAVVLFNGRPLAIPGLDKVAPAILESWFGGTEAGDGIADILFGDINPSGKLTMTFPVNVGQIPLFYNGKNTGRPINPENPYEKYRSNYLDAPNTPLYPFGYGLSYTTFIYSDIKLDRDTIKTGEDLVASVDITNTGDRDGEEIVQLYIHDVVGDVTRPVKELKGFKKVMIRKDSTITVSFTITPGDLKYYHQDMTYASDPGEFELFIGTSSDQTKKTTFILK